jgi:uncharacterized OsmC-like protein
MSTSTYQENVQTEFSGKTSNKNFQSIIAKRQTALAINYQQNPKLAWITDMACTGGQPENIKDPLHSLVTAAGENIAIGVHKAVGGDSDAIVPGELLSAALASCLDSTIRIIAERLSIQLEHLAVIVSAEIDVRGTLKLNPNVPVEFQKLHISVDLKADPTTKPSMLTALLQAAENSCVVLQTLRRPPEVTTQLNLSCK